MKNAMVLVLGLMMFSSCGDTINQTTVPGDVSVLSKFTAVTSPAVIQNLDLSQLTLNSTQDQSLVIDCDGAYGNNVVVNGVVSGQVRILGTLQKGTIQFGNTKYVGATNQTECAAVSKEAYEYTIEGTKLTLCLVNPNYNYCTDYEAN